MKELFESSYLSIMTEENDKLRKEIDRLNNIIDELEKDIKEDNQKAREYMKKVEQSGMCQGDYPVHYYYADKRIDLTEKYLERLKELKGDNN